MRPVHWFNGAKAAAPKFGARTFCGLVGKDFPTTACPEAVTCEKCRVKLAKQQQDTAKN